MVNLTILNRFIVRCGQTLSVIQQLAIRWSLRWSKKKFTTLCESLHSWRWQRGQWFSTAYQNRGHCWLYVGSHRLKFRNRCHKQPTHWQVSPALSPEFYQDGCSDIALISRMYGTCKIKLPLCDMFKVMHMIFMTSQISLGSRGTGIRMPNRMLD